MLKPVTLSVDWQGPHAAVVAFDPSTAAGLHADWPGVYLHVVRNGTGGVAATYVGKHRSSVIDRQWEHFLNYVDGKYHLFDNNGHVCFPAKSIKPQSFDKLLVNHIENTEIYFGQIGRIPSGPTDRFVDATESLLLHSPNWRSQGGQIINFNKESPVYQMFDRYEVLHSGASVPVNLFGPSTTWDRTQWAVI